MEGKNGELLVGKTRFALLYNVQGLKYTIGKQFECRECQGEFFFCKGDSVSETSHCRITCEAGGLFWVKDLQGLKGNGTFVNGERIQKKMELKFGDSLSLGVGNVTNINLIVQDHCTFLFRAVNEVDSGSQDQDEEEDASQGESQGSDVNVINVVGPSNPLKNSLVLSKIFGYLPSLSDVKNCRLVCSVWKEEATKLLKSNANVFTAFNYSKGYSSTTLSPDRSRLFSFVQEMGGFFTRGRFHVVLPTTTDSRCCGNHYTLADVRGNPEHKMLSDLTWFFDSDEGFPHPITKLSLKGTPCSSSGRNLFLAILQGASLTLEDLELDMTLDLKNEAMPNVPESFGINFPSLKKLCLRIQHGSDCCSCGCGCCGCGCGCDESDEVWDSFEVMETMKSWIISIITAAPALESLKLYSNDYLCRDFARSFLNQIISHEKGFPNLKSLNLYSYTWSVLKALLKLPMLESLTLGMSYDYDFYEDDDDGEMSWTVLMGNVLQKSAKSLKYLKLALPLLAPNQERSSILLPAFPTLEVFKLKGFHENCFTLDGIGIIKFEDHFPALKHFAVHGGNLREQNFFDKFFPQLIQDSDDDDESDDEEDDDMCDSDDGKSCLLKREEQIIKTVTFLEIANLENWSRSGVDKTDKLFPNAFNNKVLEGLRAKALIKPKWDWKKWSFVSGAEQIPIKIKKTDKVHDTNTE